MGHEDSRWVGRNLRYSEVPKDAYAKPTLFGCLAAMHRREGLLADPGDVVLGLDDAGTQVELNRWGWKVKEQFVRN